MQSLQDCHAGDDMPEGLTRLDNPK